VTGDLTSAFNFVAADPSVPSLPQPSLVDSRVLSRSCLVGAPASLVGGTIGQLAGTIVPGYPVPPNGGVPPQEPGTARRPSGLKC
jgi:phospholipase C